MPGTEPTEVAPAEPVAKADILLDLYGDEPLDDPEADDPGAVEEPGSELDELDPEESSENEDAAGPAPAAPREAPDPDGPAASTGDIASLPSL